VSYDNRVLLLADPKRPQDHDVPGEPDTIRAYAVGEPYTNRPSVTEEGKKILFGQTRQIFRAGEPSDASHWPGPTEARRPMFSSNYPTAAWAGSAWRAVLPRTMPPRAIGVSLLSP
jgi:hypothetical protein